MSKKNEVAVVEETNVLAFVAPEFQPEEVNTDDIAFPKMLLMQPISESVTDGKHTAGDVIDSVTGEKIADTKDGVEIYPIRMRKYYVVKNVDEDNKYVRTEAIISKDDMNKPWNFEENGIQMKRQPVMEIFCLSPNNSELPYLLRFKGMSFKSVGKNFYTMAFALPAAQKKAPFIRSLVITSKKEKNEKGVFFVYNFSLGKLTDAETYATCSTWFETTKTAKIEVEDPAEHVQSKSMGSEDQVPF